MEREERDCLLCRMVEECKKTEQPHDDAIAVGYVLGGMSEKFESFKEAFRENMCDSHTQLIQMHFAAAAINFTGLIKETK